MVTNLDRAATVSKFVQLESVSLKSATFSSSADPLEPAEELDAQIQYTTSCELRESNNVVLATVRFRLVAQPEGKATSMVEGPVHSGSGWYDVPGVGKVRGKANAEEAWREALASGEVDAEEVAKLEAEFLLAYRLPNEVKPEPDALDYFAQLNGTYNAWPYWRELVHTVSGRAGLAALVVPVFHPPIRTIEGPDEVEVVE